jgi:hypothetical protein
MGTALPVAPRHKALGIVEDLLLGRAPLFGRSIGYARRFRKDLPRSHWPTQLH